MELGNQAVSRRTLLRGASILGMGAGLTGLLAACGIAAEEGDAGGAAKTGGTLTLAIDGTSAVNDPAFYTTLGDWMVVDCICRGLTFISYDTTEPTPDLAESWTMSDDGLVYTFKLRQGVTFHDGTTFSSADVVASFKRQFDEKDPTLPEGASRPFNSVGKNLKEMTAPDANTFVMTLLKPDRTLLGRLSDIGARIISKAALEKYGKDIGKNLVGTGPFKFASATSGQNVTLTAFDAFRLGKPPIDRLVLQQVTDPSTIVSSLLSGDVSATQFTPYSALSQLKSDKSVTVYDTPKSFDAFIMMDVRRIPELEVRQAINLAIDRQALIAQAFFGAAVLPDGYTIPSGQDAYDASLADLSKTDVAEAKRLIQAAGATGRTVRLMAASDSWHPKAAQIIAQNLTDIGLKVETDSVDPAAYFNRLLAPDDKFHDLMIWERNGYYPDADDMIGSLARPSGVYGDFISGFNTLDGSAAYADKLFEAKNIADTAARKARYSEIQREWAEKYMTLSMLVCAANPVVSGAKVKNMNWKALGSHRTYMENASV
ncbi:ABC transporter substrate-binding protein [Actinoplanes derwentensis]|uniref:Peptide/nickel transport system substrate-binding protein n=1 Tax=Actinoplanes derwentensis TaxID=113562 RepID=A0A1H1ZH98_9ACTN|nr:ABC transporter substrate-binding protein [Actinoplanes derwentensis]GID82436.1 peptide ABC transporter substrate-binding protein [Actinoplanes derwentensis]SDT32937.1 peptide/nickel transport system substrate-binding protein [Actinoplanes derwentensis]